MSKGSNPGIKIPDVNEATPAVRTALQQIVSKFGMLSSPTFAGVTYAGLTATRLVATDASKALASVADLTAWIAGTANRVTVSSDGDGTLTITAPQDLHTGATPTFAGLTLTGLSGVLKATAGVIAGGGAHTDLAGVTADQHHAQSHVLNGADHTVSGLTAGHVLQALTATTFGFAAVPGLGPADMPSFEGVVLLGVANEAARLALDLDAGSIVYQQDTGEFWFCTPL